MAVPVTCLAWETYLITGSRQIEYYLLAFIYFSTLFMYSVHRIYGLNKIANSQLAFRHIWAKRNRVLLFAVIFLSVPGILFCLLNLSYELILFLLPIGVMTAGYTIPCIRWKGKWLRLRDIPFLKIFLIALAVSVVTVILPLVEQGIHTPLVSADKLMLFAARFFFIISITIPFDIRDVVFDNSKNLKTIPSVFGINTAKAVAIFALGLFVLATITHYLFGNFISLAYLSALLLSALFAGVIILKSASKRNEYFYSIWVEGAMIVQFLLVLLTNEMA